MSACDLFKDVGSLCCPDEGFWILVVGIDVVSDGGDELFEVLEDATLELVLGQVSEEALDHVEPRGGGWRKANMEALM